MLAVFRQKRTGTGKKGGVVFVKKVFNAEEG